MSDVGLISTQEDVIRQPMLNHISAFENSAVRVYLLVQKTASDKGWGYFSIVQDMTVDPPLDYYGQIMDDQQVNFEGTSCYKCHSSGPLAIHPAREDLVIDAKLAAALSAYIAEQPLSEFYFPERSPQPETGKPMTVDRLHRLSRGGWGSLTARSRCTRILSASWSTLATCRPTSD